MRILMLDNEFPPLGGGTGVVNKHLLDSLQAYPHIHVALVTSSRSKNTFEQVSYTDRITIYKVPVNNKNIHHSSNIELIWYTWRGFWQSVKLIRENNYDLCMAFAGVPAGFISLLVKQLFGISYIVSLQGPDVPGFEARYNWLYPFLKPLLRVIWRQASVVTAISDQHRELALQTLPSQDILIIHNGVNLSAFPQRISNVAEGIRVICVGRLIERKGQQYLLRAFAQLVHHYPGRDLQLCLVGTGDNEAALRQSTLDLGIEDEVVFLGFVPHEQMPEMYHTADIFVLPSQSEGMSIALLEALSAGLPVIVTDTGGTNELVQPGVNGLVVQWADIPGLYSALKELVENPELRQKMGEHSRKVAAEYSWDVFCDRHVTLFKMVATQTG